jgi:hypothetical protein
MQKIYPYIFPAIALVFVIFLVFRWYNLRTQEGDISPFGEGVEIENLSQEEAERVLKGSGDFKTVGLIGDDFVGQVRYEVRDSKVRFSVTANLPVLEKGAYQVWLKEVGGDFKSKAFTLDYGKAGYVGSAAINKDSLPFEVIVSQEQMSDNILEEELLKGVVPQE